VGGVRVINWRWGDGEMGKVERERECVCVCMYINKLKALDAEKCKHSDFLLVQRFGCNLSRYI
jgi:hypothetical protein